MGGTANICDKELLQPGSPCIIYIDSVNTSDSLREGYWMGKVLTATSQGEGSFSYLSVTAEIDRGPLQLNTRTGNHVASEAGKGQKPLYNYSVLPDSQTTRRLIWDILQERRARMRSERQAATYLEVHKQTMAHLVRQGLAEKEQVSTPADAKS